MELEPALQVWRGGDFLQGCITQRFRRGRAEFENQKGGGPGCSWLGLPGARLERADGRDEFGKGRRKEPRGASEFL